MRNVKAKSDDFPTIFKVFRRKSKILRFSDYGIAVVKKCGRQLVRVPNDDFEKRTVLTIDGGQVRISGYIKIGKVVVIT